MIIKQALKVSGYRHSVQDESGQEVGRGFLYVMKNDLHEEPFGFLEDVFVDDACRGQGYGKLLIGEIIKTARELGCYKLVATSRHAREAVHELYKKIGFQDYGKEFRLDF